MLFIKIFTSFIILSFLLKPEDVITITKNLKKIKKYLQKYTKKIKNKAKMVLKKQFNIDMDKICLNIQNFQQNYLLSKQKPNYFVENDLTNDNFINFSKAIKTSKNKH